MAKSFHLAPFFIDREQFRIQIVLIVMLKLLHYWLWLRRNNHIIIFLKAKLKYTFIFANICSVFVLTRVLM